MKSNYKRIGDYIRLVDERNTGLKVTDLLGLTIAKTFIPSVANIIGADMENYKIIRRNQFACSTMQVRRDGKMPVALLADTDEAIISQAYPVFEVADKKQLLPEYLMMWFSRKEFDREACFYAIGGVRGSLEWSDFCDMRLPVPPIEKQREIVAEYHAVQKRINLNNQIIQTLEATAQAIYKQWFVDFEFPNAEGKPYKSNGGEMVESEMGKVPKGWRVVPLKSICSKIGSGATPKGGKESYYDSGISLIRSTNVYDYLFSLEDLAFIDEKQAKALNVVTVQEKDILINITGVSVARCCMVPKFVLPARVNQHVMIIRANEHDNFPYYLLCTLCFAENKAKLLGISQSGSTREAITKSEIENFLIVAPNKDIVGSFEKRATRIFEQMETQVLLNNKLDNLQDLLLSKMAKEE
ncbi:MAG: restriction endonuclease subunit S [Bacteroidales bacterium]|jgi:type I restriction enzyme S subunit|nr:restriction endonuclease subunit S [Bacteroidales bacterium]